MKMQEVSGRAPPPTVGVTPMTDRETVERVAKQLAENGAVGLDLSPGDPVQAEAATFLLALLARAEAAERERDEARNDRDLWADTLKVHGVKLNRAYAERDEARETATTFRGYLQAEENFAAAQAGDEPRNVVADNPFPWEAHP